MDKIVAFCKIAAFSIEKFVIRGFRFPSPDFCPDKIYSRVFQPKLINPWMKLPGVGFSRSENAGSESACAAPIPRGKYERRTDSENRCGARWQIVKARK